MKISAKTPSEVIPVIFDYSELLPNATLSIVSTSIAVISGTDASASAMLYGAPVLDGLTVVQLVRNGVAGVTYNLACLVAVGSEKYQIDGNIDCKARHS
jgi:hypothetical protein